MVAPSSGGDWAGLDDCLPGLRRYICKRRRISTSEPSAGSLRHFSSVCRSLRLSSATYSNRISPGIEVVVVAGAGVVGVVVVGLDIASTRALWSVVLVSVVLLLLGCCVWLC